MPKKERLSKGILKWLRRLVMFGFCTIAWVFFASQSISDAIYIISHFHIGIFSPAEYVIRGIGDIGIGKEALFRITLYLLVLFLFDFVALQKDIIRRISEQTVVVRWSIYVVFLIFLLAGIPVTASSEFIYFQF